MSDDDAIEVDFHPVLMPSPDLRMKRVPNPHGKGGVRAHPPHVELAYFRCWYFRHRPGATELLTLIEEDWPLYAPEGEPFVRVVRDTLKDWMHRHEWARKANDLTLGQSTERAMAFQTATFELGEQSVQFARDLLAGKFKGEDQFHVRNQIEAMKIGIQAAGAGTFGTRDRTAPKLRAAIAKAVDAYVMDEQELNRQRREALHAGRTDHEERKR